jgi:aminoglycoside 6'-N-acetyltransferase
VIRPATEADVPAITALLAEPGVARWWGDTPEADVREMLGSAFVIVAGGEIAGWLQYEEETWFQGPHVAFDVAIADAFTGRGLAGEALREAVAHFAARGHHRFTIDPAVANERAIRAYAKVGFRPVGVLRQSSKVRPEDPYEDDLLMDLLAGELT